MQKYFRVSLAILKNNLIREMEFRANFLLWLFIQGVWVGLQILIVQVLFQYTDAIYGWTQPEVFMLIGMFRVSRGLFDFFVYANLTDLPDIIDSGNLDYSLTKPISALYLASFRRHQYDQLGTFLTGIAFIAYAWPGANVPLTIILIICGFVAFYSLILIISTLSFYLTKLTAIGSTHDILNTILRYPIDLLVGNRGQADVLLLPLTVIVTIPAKIVLGKAPQSWFWLEIASVVIFFLLAYGFWKYSLRRYSSASS
jgi:ABC-2 type transport system permease protein